MVMRYINYIKYMILYLYSLFSTSPFRFTFPSILLYLLSALVSTAVAFSRQALTAATAAAGVGRRRRRRRRGNFEQKESQHFHRVLPSIPLPSAPAAAASSSSAAKALMAKELQQQQQQQQHGLRTLVTASPEPGSPTRTWGISI
jgi:hypothetical protein